MGKLRHRVIKASGRSAVEAAERKRTAGETETREGGVRIRGKKRREKPGEKRPRRGEQGEREEGNLREQQEVVPSPELGKRSLSQPVEPESPGVPGGQGAAQSEGDRSGGPKGSSG